MKIIRKSKNFSKIFKAINDIKDRISAEKRKDPYPEQKEKLRELYDRLDKLITLSEEDKKESIFERPMDIYLERKNPFVDDEMNELLDPDSVRPHFPNNVTSDFELAKNKMNWYKKSQVQMQGSIGKTRSFIDSKGRKFYVHYYQKCKKCGEIGEDGREVFSYDNPYVCSKCGGHIINKELRSPNYIGSPKTISDVSGSWDNLVRLLED